ncbi:MAG: helix-turn-helix transcriptional regulator [Alphaproteobacteria bacterium]|nr:helix-turn-helix transcriptional regulator [Alphaproteobacteria bacterium]
MDVAAKNKIKKTELRSENPDPVDIHVGARLRMRRNLVGLSQEQLGKSLGLTFQQIQKYERGINRMGSSRLFQIAKTLSIPVSYFFEDLPSTLGATAQQGFAESGQEPLEGGSASEHQSDYDILRRRETLELIRAYYRIQDSKQRRKVYELIRSMSDEG